MKIQLIKTLDKFILVSDEKINAGKDYYFDMAELMSYIKDPSNPNFKWIVKAREDFTESNSYQYKIIAGISELPKIDFSMLSEEDSKFIGYFDINKLALSEYTIPLNKRKEERTPLVGHSSPFGFNKFLKAYKKGFNTSLSFRKFSLEDIIEAITLSRKKKKDDFEKNCSDYEYSYKNIIELLNSPKLLEVEVEMEIWNNNGITSLSRVKPKVQNNTIKIIKLI